MLHSRVPNKNSATYSYTYYRLHSTLIRTFAHFNTKKLHFHASQHMNDSQNNWLNPTDSLSTSVCLSVPPPPSPPPLYLFVCFPTLQSLCHTLPFLPFPARLPLSLPVCVFLPGSLVRYWGGGRGWTSGGLAMFSLPTLKHESLQPSSYELLSHNAQGKKCSRKSKDSQTTIEQTPSQGGYADSLTGEQVLCYVSC